MSETLEGPEGATEADSGKSVIFHFWMTNSMGLLGHLFSGFGGCGYP